MLPVWTYVLIAVFAVFLVVILVSINASYNRGWSKKQAKSMIEKGINKEKDYWIVRDNLQKMQENDSEAVHLLDKLKELKPA